MEQDAQTEFVPKLYQMLDNPNYRQIVSWGEEPGTFVIYDTTAFQELVIPQVFKHSNFSSFVRQLNKYDFHKVRFKDSPSRFCEFQHPEFKPENRDVPHLIKRKEVQTRKQIPTALIEDLVKQLEALTSRVDSLEMDNIHLLGVVNRQEQVISRFQQTLRSGVPIGTRTRFLVALDDADGRRICAKFISEYAGNSAHIDQVSSGTEVLDYTERHYYDGIVIDLVLAGVDGITATENLRTRGFKGPIILCIEEDVDPARRDSFFKRGASGILTRPFNRNTLYDQLNRSGI